MNTRSKEEIRDTIIFVCLDLYNSLLPCGAKSIRKKLVSMDVEPLPSESKIYRVLRDNYLTHGRAGYPDDM